MGQHRMFSLRIANSAKFLQMPADAQLLYFHLTLRADDDGIVEAYPILKLLSLPADNFKILLAKEFIKILNDEQILVITDWREHNTIRADRKTDSIYLPLLKAKFPEMDIIKARPRVDVRDNSRRLANQMSMDSPRTYHGQHKVS